jgi:hypothetical protein
MKSSLLVLPIVISAIAITQIAYANPENVHSAKDENDRAAALVTKPATITNEWDSLEQTNNLQQPPRTITLIRDKGCRTINPLEIIKNPEAVIKECEQQPDNQPPQNTVPNDYFKTPGIDSGVNVTVTKF